jgi:hypothetical protein
MKKKLSKNEVLEAIEMLFDPRRTAEDVERSWRIIRKAEKIYGKKKVKEWFKQIQEAWSGSYEAKLYRRKNLHSRTALMKE